MGLMPYTGSLFTNLVAQGYYENIFAVHLGGEHHGSHVTFGGVHSSYKFSEKKPVNYASIMKAGTWSVAATGLKWNNINLFSIDDKMTIFDLGMEGITLPSSEYSLFRDQLYASKDWQTKEDASTGTLFLDGVDCGDVKFPSLEIIFANSEATGTTGNPNINLKIPKESYLKQAKGDCQVMVSKGDSTIVLGEAFLRNYYTIFDGANSRIGFSLSNTNQFPADQPSSMALPIWAIIVIVLVGLGVVGGIVVFVIRKRRQPDEEARAIYKQVEERQTADDSFQ